MDLETRSEEFDDLGSLGTTEEKKSLREDVVGSKVVYEDVPSVRAWQDKGYFKDDWVDKQEIQWQCFCGHTNRRPGRLRKGQKGICEDCGYVVRLKNGEDSALLGVF